MDCLINFTNHKWQITSIPSTLMVFLILGRPQNFLFIMAVIIVISSSNYISPTHLFCSIKLVTGEKIWGKVNCLVNFFSIYKKKF